MKAMVKPLASLCAALALLALGTPAVAEADAGAAAVDHSEVRYVPLQPSFVANFGDGEGGRLMYVKADVSLRVTGADAATAARYHLPALRNAMVLLLSRQDEASVSSGSGRETLRAQALADMRAILEDEEGEPCIDDVLFTNFFVQR